MLLTLHTSGVFPERIRYSPWRMPTLIQIFFGILVIGLGCESLKAEVLALEITG